MSVQNVIELANVNYAYNQNQVLKNVSLNVEKGDFLAIIGPNGGGKTTLLRFILGVLQPESGTVKLLGDNPVRTRSKAGYIPQETSVNKLFPISVHDVVRMGLTAKRGLGRKFTKEDSLRADEILTQFGLNEMRKRCIAELSGGQRQKVLLARALVSKPEILFLDEPTSSIDTSGTDEVYEHLKDLNAAGTTVALVTHNIGVMSKYIKSVACVNRELYFHPDGKLTEHTITKTYGCAVDLIAHGIPHRVFHSHQEHNHHDT